MKESLEKTVPEELTPFRNKVAKSSCEFFGAVVVMVGEILRTALVPSSSFMLNSINPDSKPLLGREENSFFYDTLQHMGDLFEGYMTPFFVNNTLSYTIPKLSENLRLGLSLVLSDAFIFSVESGTITMQQQPDYMDLPAAVLGNILYIGMNYLARNPNFNIFYDMVKKDKI